MTAVEQPKRKILVAVDDGEESIYALEWCLKNIVNDQNNGSKDTLVLLYASPPPVVYGAMDGTGYLLSSDIMHIMERHKKEMVKSVIEKAKMVCKDLQNVKVETMWEIGDARDVICNTAEKLQVDMVVMGSHGYGIIKRTLLGSVSNHCAQNLKCPVLVVKRKMTTK
ncbi:universal stress protein YxiE-like [Impatiens glandulifera]|uniref:universal stress protein YxiE-like n=1 Tax=Impatiens glandulifera TaxID=253017 RepID=UPI001FB11378|nr:universal stress protein YxiE-like [Impatiens glandulifera]